jgi:hypothetical protein
VSAPLSAGPARPVAALAAALLLACAPPPAAPPPQPAAQGLAPAPPRGDEGPRVWLSAQTYHQTAHPYGPGQGRYRFIVLQPAMADRLPQIRAANPGARVLTYMKAGGMRADGDDRPSTGVQIQEAEEGWFLHDLAGQRLEFCDYPGVAAAHLRSPGYRQRWVENVVRRTVADGWDGLMIDDLNLRPGHCLGERGSPLAEHPTDQDYGEAAVEFLAAVAPALREAGLIVAPNVAMNPWEPVHMDQLQRMLPHMTHLVREYWMRWNASAHFRGGAWSATQATLEAAQAAGVGYLALTYGPGAEGHAAGQRYGRGSFLLGWDGASDSAWAYLKQGDGTGPLDDPWGPGFEPDVGRPTGPAVAQGEAWLRPFERGLVAVHPGEGGPVTLELGGTFTDADLGPVTRLRLEGGEARILAR